MQKFISLADGQRKIEGVLNGQSKTYGFRSKHFCVVMAGNPYTERGDKFQIPDMRSNRAGIYNLGDVANNRADLFKLSLIENGLTSNPILKSLTQYRIYFLSACYASPNIQNNFKPLRCILCHYLLDFK